MDRKTALDLLACSIRPVLLAHLDEARALGKKAQANKAAGQNSLFGDEEEDREERMKLIDAQVIAAFKAACQNWWREEFHRPSVSRLEEWEVDPKEEARFWDYHRRQARLGR